MKRPCKKVRREKLLSHDRIEYTVRTYTLVAAAFDPAIKHVDPSPKRHRSSTYILTAAGSLALRRTYKKKRRDKVNSFIYIITMYHANELYITFVVFEVTLSSIYLY